MCLYVCAYINNIYLFSSNFRGVSLSELGFASFNAYFYTNKQSNECSTYVCAFKLSFTSLLSLKAKLKTNQQRCVQASKKSESFRHSFIFMTVAANMYTKRANKFITDCAKFIFKYQTLIAISFLKLLKRKVFALYV